MTGTPKRRGRPLGSKNKPKVIPTKAKAVFDVTYPEPVEIDASANEGAGEPLDALTGQILQPRHIFVRWKVALGQRGEEVELDWPEAWPLPQPGDMIQWGDRMHGFVSHCVFDVRAGRIFLQVR